MGEKKHRNLAVIFIPLVLVFVLLLLTACGALEVGIERTTTPNAVVTATGPVLATGTVGSTSHMATPTPTLALSALAAGELVLWEWAEWRCRRRGAGLRAQAEERRRFLQRLDHELRNPLTAIRAGLANVVNGLATDAQRDALASVEMQVLRLSRLTADLRKLAELETHPLEWSAVDVAELLQEAVALAREQPEADERHLTLMLPPAPWPMPDVLGDRDLLLLAICNLLDNALKFTQPGDRVEVRAFEDGTSVAIEVADTGPGIPQEELPRVWDELYRGQGARGIPGSGLGLALVRAIVERHRGTVTVRSRVGQGTLVTMELPVRNGSER